MYRLKHTPNLFPCLIRFQSLTPYLLALAYCVQLPFVSVAQQLSTKFTIDQYQVEAKIWGRQDGLLSLEVGGLFQDSRGFVWVQNLNNLYRFDGSKFSLVESLNFVGKTWNENPFGSVEIREDVHGNIWRNFCNRNEVRIYNPATDQHYTLQDYVGTDTIPDLPSDTRMIAIDRVIYIIHQASGRIWAYDGTFKQVFHDTVNAYWRQNNSALREKGTYTYYMPGPNRQFWIIHPEHGVILCTEKGVPLEHYPNLLPVNKYRFFIAAGNQLYYYPFKFGVSSRPTIYKVGDPEVPLTQSPALHREFFRKNFIATPPDDLSIIVEGYANTKLNLWGKNSSSQNLLEFLWDIIYYPLKVPGEIMILYSSLPYQADNGDIWVNTNMGLVQIRFQKLRFESWFKGHSFRSITWRDNQTFYGIHYSKGAILCDLFHTGDIPRKLPLDITNGTGVHSLAMKDQEFWVGFKKHILHYNKAKQLVGKFATPNPSNIALIEAYDPLFLANGHILYCTSNGLLEIDGAGNSRYVLEGISIECLQEDRKGDVWAGTSKGIYHLATQTMFLGALPGNKPLFVNHIHEAADGRFWLATNQGLFRWKPFGQEYEQFTVREGLSDNTLHAVYPGAGEWLWLSSNNGIMAFNSQTKRVRAFFTENGLAHNEQNHRAHSLGPDGRLYFGGINGITRFDPNDISFDKGASVASSSIFLQKISFVDSDKGNSTEIFRGLVNEIKTPLDLPAGTFQMVVSIAQPFFQNKMNHQIEWRIEGSYPNWSAVPASGDLIVSGLPVGNFNLEIRARDVTYTDNTKSLVIPFRKAYAFYQRPWFWLLAAGLIFLASFLFTRWRVRSLNARNMLLKEMVEARTQDLAHSNANILQQKEQLERIDASKTQLFNNISHEFRTPLTLIQGYAETLLMSLKNENPAIGKPANSIKAQAIRLSKMIQEIMDLSRLQQGIIQLKKEPVDWTSFLQTEFYLFEGQAQQKQLDYQLHIHPNEKVYITIDRQKVERILHNLISNAIKFTPDAGRILVHCTIRETEIEVVVADTGPGVVEGEQALIFNRYFQGSAPRQTAQTGYGIGLALCREYVELMKGRLWVESLPGKGASFFFVFPKELASVAAITPPEQAINGIGQARTFAHLIPHQKQNHLLIVEDNEQVLSFLVEILAEDYHISKAANGEEALALLEIQPEIDLILSDAMMPVMDGFTLLQKTRSHPVWGFIPFMMITALTAEEGKLQALRLGVDAFLTKPFEVVELKTQIRNLIRNQELRKGFRKQPIPISGKDEAQDTSLPGHKTMPPEEQPSEISYDEQWMNDLQAAVLKNMGNFDFKVSDLAFLMHISERTLRNYLKTYTGLAPSDFLQKARLDRAKQLVKDKKYRTIAEVAYAVGFKDAKHFSKLFNKEFGKSPTDYLK